MIYILTALKSEAQAFVDKFKLDSTKQNNKLSVIVSGIGSENMFKSASEVASKMTKDDIVINVGICAASKKYNIGDLLDEREVEITSVDHEVDYKKYDVVDMESGGFKDATKNVDKKYIFKIVSDHFEPKAVKKDLAKKLIFDKIDKIMERVS